jgi:CheY-like chemotaxis protein
MSEKTVLIVEDHEVQREGLAAVLRNEGYTVLVAEDGGEASGVVRVGVPDLILLDMMLPAPTGGGSCGCGRSTPRWRPCRCSS